MLEITMAELHRELVRCSACAGELVPAELPALVSPPPSTPLTMTRFTADMLPLDFKQRQAAAEREPGEDDV